MFTPILIPASSEFLFPARCALAGSLCSHGPVPPQGTDPSPGLEEAAVCMGDGGKEEGQMEPQNKLKLKSWMWPLSKRTPAISTANIYQASQVLFLLRTPATPKRPPTYCTEHLSLLQLQPPSSPEAPDTSTMARFHNSPPRPVVASFLQPTFTPSHPGEACHTPHHPPPQKHRHPGVGLDYFLTTFSP